MYPILYEKITPGTVPQTHGLGTLSDALSCEVEHVGNGIYELVIEYPITGIHAQEIAYRRVIKAKPNFTDDPQLFRIARVGKVMNGSFTIYARHISYDLSGCEITSGTAGSAVAAAALLQAAAPNYTITTDKTVSATFKIDEPGSVKSYFIGRKGSFLDVYGKTEIKYDNFSVQFLLNAGQDRGVTVNYGKNLLELSQEIDASNLYTHVRCYYKQTDEAAIVGNKVATGLTLDVDRCLIVDVTQEYQEAPSVSTLTTRAQQYISNNNLTVPSNNITLNFAQGEQLKDRVDLFDTVSVYYEALGITRTSMKCIRTKWDCIKEKYIEVELGDARTDVTDTIALNNKAIAKTPSTSFMEEAIAHATELITGNLGGHLILHDSNGDGEPDELLIMDTDDISTAVNVWRFNQAGWGHSSNGYDGVYTLAATLDGGFVADFITAGSMSGNRVRTGLISSTNNQLQIDLDAGTITAPSITLNGEDVESTLDNLVQTSVVTRYALSNSGTVIPDTFGLTDPTTPTEQQPYLWSRTIYTYANGQENTSYAVSARGTNGVNGADGAGLNILGNYATMADLIADHPTGSAGQAYMVDTDLVVWNTQTNSWQNVGRIQGANGADGFWLTIENDDDGTLANVTYTARLMRGNSDVTASYNSVFAWYMVKEGGTTLLAEDTSTITVSRDAADYGATIRCVVIAVVSEEDLEDYSYIAITDYNGNIIQIIGTNNVKLIGESNIYKPYAISSQFQVLADEISSKVEQTEFNSLSGTVSSQGTLIQQNSDAIALKANQTTVDTLSDTVSSQGTAIEQNAEQIELKANTSTVNSQMNGKMATDMSNRSSSITINSGEIKFESNTVSISATNLTVTKTGQVTAVDFKAKNSFWLNDANNVGRGYLSYNSVGGTSFGEYTQSGKLVAVISAADGDGGQLRLYNPLGNQIVNTGTRSSDHYEGMVRINNAQGNLRTWLCVAAGGGGYWGLYNSDGSGQSVYANGTNGTIVCVQVQQTSSRKVKDNIKPIEDAEKILELQAVSFDYKDRLQGTDRRGFIAEDVAEVLPNLVTQETEETPATLDYIGMIPYLQAVIKAQDERIKALEDKLNAIMKEKEK